MSYNYGGYLERIAKALEGDRIRRVDLEHTLRSASNAVADVERKLAEEYLLKLASGQQTWAAQKMAEVTHGPALRAALTEYEIALARLRRA